MQHLCQFLLINHTSCPWDVLASVVACSQAPCHHANTMFSSFVNLCWGPHSSPYADRSNTVLKERPYRNELVLDEETEGLLVEAMFLLHHKGAI